MSPWLSDLFLRSQSDERLMSLAGAGHDRAFAAIVERYGPELQAHARRLCVDGPAEDVVQQAFLSAFAALRSGTEVRHLRGWLYQIVRNAAIRLHAPRGLPIDDVALSGAPLEDDVETRALALSALSEVGRLPERQREALVGTVQGRRRAEIAMSMGLSEGAVRQLVHRARLSIRAAITAVSPYPLARWLAAARPGAGTASEIAMTAGAASAGGAAMKFSALLASGVLAGGIVIGIEPPPQARHFAQHASPRAHGTRGTSRWDGEQAPAASGGGPAAPAVVAAELVGSGGGRGGRGRGGPGSGRGSEDRLAGSGDASGRGGPGGPEEHADGGGSGPGAEGSHSGPSARSGSGSGSADGGAGLGAGGGPGPGKGGSSSGASASSSGSSGSSSGTSDGSSGSRDGGGSRAGSGSRRGR